MSEEQKSAEQGLLAKINEAVANNKPLEAEQWTHAYLQFQHALQMSRAQ